MFNNATAYNGYIGRWSRLVGEQFVSWLHIPPDRNWLDVGAGTGILTQVVLQKVAPRKVIGIDIAEGFIELARQDVGDERAEFITGDVSTLISGAPEFDVAISGLVLNFVPSPEQTLQVMTQLVKAGGTVASYVWDYAGRMEIMRHFWDAAAVIDPNAAAADAGKQFPICDPRNLQSAFEAQGLQKVDVIPIDIQAKFKNFDDFWLPFLGAQGSVSKYLLSLDEATKQAIIGQLHKQLPINADGSIDLIARAWAAKGSMR